MGYVHPHMVMPGFKLILVSISNHNDLQMFRVIHLFFQQPRRLLVFFSFFFFSLLTHFLRVDNDNTAVGKSDECAANSRNQGGSVGVWVLGSRIARESSFVLGLRLYPTSIPNGIFVPCFGFCSHKIYTSFNLCSSDW